MEQNKINPVEFIKQAADTNRKVEIEFESEVLIPIHKKYKTVKVLRSLIFSATTNDNQVLPYGYKMRIQDRSGYRIDSLPLYKIKSICFVDEKETEHSEDLKRKFKLYVESAKDPDVWPNMGDIIDRIGTNIPVPYSEYSAKLYLASKMSEYDMAEVERLFKERKSTKYYFGDYGSEKLIELDQREDGYYAWYVDGPKTWIMINPRVAILGRKSI